MSQAKPQRRSQVVAAIDCGTAGVRATVAEINGRDSVRVLEECSRPIDLYRVFERGQMRRVDMDSIVAGLEDILVQLAAYDVDSVRVVATSAWREAANVDVLLERIQLTCDLKVELVDGGELARLYFEAFNRVLRREQRKLTGTTVLADLGSGTTVIGLIKSGKLTQAVEEHFGTMRILQEFGDLVDSLDFHNAIDRLAHGTATLMIRRLGIKQCNTLVVTGDEIRTLAQMVGGDGLLPTIAVADVQAWIAGSENLSLRSLAERLDISPSRVAALLVGAHLLRHLAGEFGASEVLVPTLNLREGMLADHLPGALGPHHLPRTTMLAIARSLSARYGMNRAYAENTRALAVQIFDQIAHLHRCSTRERLLLEMAALVHDVGAWVNARSRHKHSSYLIESTDIAGLSAIEKTVVAQIARYHRRSTPKSSHKDFQALPRHLRVVVSYLAAILRLAYALDVERQQRIREVRCRVLTDRLVMQVDRRQITLERWSIRQRAQMFTQVFGLDVDLISQDA